MVIFIKKDFDMAHPEAEWPSQQNTLILYFFVFHYFFSSTCKQNFGRTVTRKFSIGGFMFVRGARRSHNVY